MRQILILILFLLINTNAFADKKFEKDLKKISKDNAFIDNTGKIYSVGKVDHKKNNLINYLGKLFKWKSKEKNTELSGTKMM